MQWGGGYLFLEMQPSPLMGKTLPLICSLLPFAQNPVALTHYFFQLPAFGAQAMLLNAVNV